MGKLKYFPSQTKKNTKRSKVKREYWKKKRSSTTYDHLYSKPKDLIHSGKKNTESFPGYSHILHDHMYHHQEPEYTDECHNYEMPNETETSGNSYVLENVEYTDTQSDLEVASYLEVESELLAESNSLLCEISCQESYISNGNELPTGENFSNLEYSFISQEEYESIMGHTLEVEAVHPEENKHLLGYMIVDLNYVLDWSMKLQVDHSKICTTGMLKVKGEERTGMGLVSAITFECNMCGYEITHLTDKDGTFTSKLNMGAVWGTLTTGSTYNHTKELLSCMDIPCMPYSMFHKTEIHLGNGWKDSLWENIEAAGKEEYAMALEKGQVDKENNVWTVVYLDGGWSHRSYGHNYNAASGIAVIIGQLTGKVLYIGVRNKYCSVCARAINKQKVPREHVCYKNWSSSSGAMEADIVVEGFKSSLQMHNLKYLKFIADGDSSVFSKIKNNVPYGMEVEKTECKNHAIKCYGSVLYKIKKDTHVNVQGRKLLTATIIKNLQNVAQRAIYVNAHGDIESLKKDLANGPNHVFGNHSQCNENYCQNVGKMENNRVPEIESTGALDRLIRIGKNLIDNETSNRAELFMSLLCKYNAGKRLNLTQRGSFESRAYLAGLRYNEGVAWHYGAWEKIVHGSPGKNFQDFLKSSTRTYEVAAKRRLSFPTIQKTQDNASRMAKQKKSFSGEKDYGPKVPMTMLSKEDYDDEVNRLLCRFKVTSKEVEEIERTTVGQWGNPRFEAERRDRLTASVFGEVVKRRKGTPCHNLVKKILYGTSFHNEAMEYGRQKENAVRLKFSKSKPQANVKEAGIFIDENYGYLAASPDGLVGNNGLLEIKCLHSVHKSGKTLREAVETNKNLCMELRDDKIRLKKSHNYYYQVQGQLNIAKKDVCFFVIYINDKQPLYLEVICKDKNFWEYSMLPKLKTFYIECVLPEIIYRNVPKGLKCKEPHEEKHKD